MQWVIRKRREQRAFNGACAAILYPVFPSGLSDTANLIESAMKVGAPELNMYYVVEPTSICLETFLIESMKEGRFTWKLTYKLVGQSYNILSTLMLSRVIHRNFAVDSIFLKENSPEVQYTQPQLLLLDYSLACISGTLNPKKSTCYLTSSPEERCGKELAFRDALGIDIYSFGILVWEFLPKLKFVRGNSVMCQNIFPSDTPEILRTLIKSCLQTEPSCRPSLLDILKTCQDCRYELNEMKFDLPLDSGDCACVICLSEAISNNCENCGGVVACNACFVYVHECPHCQKPLPGRDETYFDQLTEGEGNDSDSFLTWLADLDIDNVPVF